MNRSIAVVITAMIAALAAVGVVTGESEESGSEPETSGGPSLEQVARRVEQVRQLEFERLPRVRRVSEREARRIGLRQLGEQLPPRVLRGEERVLQLLGLLGDTSLRDVLGRVFSSEIGGFYLPGTGTLYLVEGTGLAGAFGDVLLAHELTHALEDQHFGLQEESFRGLWRDRETAAGALAEGSATVAMVDYLARAQGGRDLPPEVRSRALEALDDVALPPSSGLPRYFRESLIWPYVAGARLVDRIESEADWQAVDDAWEAGLPASSEQVMHVRAFESRERPVRVRIEDVRAVLPDGSHRRYAADIGEWDTEQVLRDANGSERSGAAAAGWGGGAFELWELPGADDVLVLRWEWDSARDAREFETALRRSAERLVRANVVTPAGERGVVLAQATDPALARRAARQAAQRR